MRYNTGSLGLQYSPFWPAIQPILQAKSGYIANRLSPTCFFTSLMARKKAHKAGGKSRKYSDKSTISFHAKKVGKKRLLQADCKEISYTKRENCAVFRPKIHSPTPHFFGSKSKIVTLLFSQSAKRWYFCII